MSSKLRKARCTDVQPIYELLKHMAARQLLLPRSLANIYESLQTFFVAEDDGGQITGVAALQVAWENLGEVRSLAVLPEHGSKGLGRALTGAVEDEAKELGLGRLFSLTYVPGFFERLGYRQVALESLPQKIWSVCFKCVHYPNCQETAMVKDICPNA